MQSCNSIYTRSFLGRAALLYTFCLVSCLGFPKDLNKQSSLNPKTLDPRSEPSARKPQPRYGGFPKIRGTIFGVPMIRTIVYLGLYWGPLILGNYYIYIHVTVNFHF